MERLARDKHYSLATFNLKKKLMPLCPPFTDDFFLLPSVQDLQFQFQSFIQQLYHVLMLFHQLAISF
jgi:hypothetical protein